MALVGTVVALLVLGVGFSLVERRWAAIPGQRRLRRGFVTDLAYALFTPLVGPVVRKAAVIFAVIVVALATGVSLGDGRGLAAFHEGRWIAAQPRWLQGLAALVVVDFVGYWIHRLFHRRRLWRFHAVHHSSEELDWLSSVRVHPLQQAIGAALGALPLLLVGFDVTVIAFLTPALLLYGILLHANVPWTFGRWRFVVASPAFHRWHHTCERDGMNKNFAGLLPVWDVVFGTFYMPRGRQPVRFGVESDPVPRRFLGQLAYPLRRRARDA